MTGRIVATATLVVALIVAAAVALAHARLDAMRAAFDGRVAFAQELLAQPIRASALARLLETADLHVVVVDHVNNVAYDDRDGQLERRAVPPMPPDAPPPRLPPPPKSGFYRLVGSIVGREPQRIGDPYRTSAIIMPGLPGLARFLVADALVTLVLIAGVIAAAIVIGTRLANRARNQLESMVEERHALATEYQRFLADAGHELRTPLTIVSGYVEILGGEPLVSQTGRQVLDGLRAETARMRALVERMLLLARLESSVAIPRLVDAADVAGDVVAQMRARYPERELTLRSRSALIISDQDDLYEAVRNLVENALRYAPGSPVDVDVASDVRVATIAVRDCGSGISPEEQGAIFERFYRGNGRTDGEGSGLGLAIVSRVAQRWNGGIAVDSHPGRTTFTLSFPLAEEEAV